MLDYAVVSLSGTFLRVDRVPAKGAVEVFPSRDVIIGGQAIMLGSVRVPLDDDGRFSMVLPASDDPVLGDPITYLVRASMHHATWVGKDVVLPASVASVDLADATKGAVVEYPSRGEWDALVGATMAEVLADAERAEQAAITATSAADAAAVDAATASAAATTAVGARDGAAASATAAAGSAAAAATSATAAAGAADTAATDAASAVGAAVDAGLSATTASAAAVDAAGAASVAESARHGAVAASVVAVQAKDTAALAATSATDASASAGVSMGLAAAAKDGAETARDTAEGYKVTAVGASVDASSARDDARAARDQAIAAAGLVTDRLGPVHHTGLAWYQAGATNPDTYQAVNAQGQDAGLLAGNTGFTRQAAGVPVSLELHSRIRRCILRNDGGSVAYYLDADDSTIIAGIWDASQAKQSGWVRVHEGAFDPVAPTPGQATTGDPGLRARTPDWDAAVSYGLGARVTHGGALWDSLAAHNLGVTPAPGTAAADLSGAAGQVMVEIPRFYSKQSFDLAANRQAWEIVFVPADAPIFPLLEVESLAAPSVTVNGRVFDVHPAFAKAGVQRPARYVAAFGTSATDTTNNGVGVLQSIFDGETTNTTTVSLTNGTAKARNRNAGLIDPSGEANNVWQVTDNWLWNAVQLAYLTEYRTLYSQGVLGGGNQSGNIYNKIAGRSAPAGNASGSFDAAGAIQTPTTGNFDGMTYRGIEDAYGTAYRRTAGGVVRNAPAGKELHFSNDPSKFVDTSATSPSYELVASGGLVPAADGWQQPGALIPGAFFASAAGGSAATYLTDGNYLRAAVDDSVNILSWGGAAGGGSIDGFFALFADRSAALAYAYNGFSLAR